VDYSSRRGSIHNRARTNRRAGVAELEIERTDNV
jgi:hypothetical protein